MLLGNQGTELGCLVAEEATLLASGRRPTLSLGSLLFVALEVFRHILRSDL